VQYGVREITVPYDERDADLDLAGGCADNRISVLSAVTTGWATIRPVSDTNIIVPLVQVCADNFVVVVCLNE
jgi:hypothetical protein